MIPQDRSDAMGGNTSRFFVRPSAASGPGEAPGPTPTLPWGPSPLPKKAEEFQGDDLGQSGDDFGLELSEGTPAPLSRSGPQPVPVLSPAELLSPAAIASSPTTGAIPLPPEPGLLSPLPAAPPGPNPFSVAAASGASSPVPGSLRPATTGAIPLPPFATPAPAPRATTFRIAPADPESPRNSGPLPLPPTVPPVRATPAPAPPWHPPAPAPRGATTLETHVVVPLPSKGGPGQPLPDPSSPLEPLPWAMPATPLPSAGGAPSKASGPVPLPGGKGSMFSPPRGLPVAAPPPPAFPPPPESIEIASDAWGGEGDGPTVLAPEEPAAALELLAEPRTVSGLTPLPAPRDPQAEAVRLFERARELQNLDDHSGARELLLQAQGFYPELTGLTEALARSETKLQTIYESKIGKLSAVPRVRLKEDEVIWLNLDHRAGFMLAQIDGTLSFEDLFSVSGMSRLDTARILAQLLDQRVILS